MKKLLIAVVVLSTANTVSADPVTVRIGFEGTGSGAELAAFIQKGTAMQQRINPDNGASATLWADVAHGAGTPGVSLILSYPNLAAWAKANDNNDKSAEWGQFMQTFPQGFNVVYQGMGNILWQSESRAPQSGEVMLIYGFTMNGAGPQGLIETAQKAKALSKKMGIDSIVSVGIPIAAGQGAGGATVTVRFPSRSAWAAAAAKQQASAEWQQLVAGMPQTYTMTYQGISRAL